MQHNPIIFTHWPWFSFLAGNIPHCQGSCDVIQVHPNVTWPGTWPAWLKTEVDCQGKVRVFFQTQDLKSPCYSRIVQLVLWTPVTLRAVEKFRICSPEREHSLRFQLRVLVRLLSGLLCWNFAGTFLESCFKSFALGAELMFPSAIKPLCLGTLFLKLLQELR